MLFKYKVDGYDGIEEMHAESEEQLRHLLKMMGTENIKIIEKLGQEVQSTPTQIDEFGDPVANGPSVMPQMQPGARHSTIPEQNVQAIQQSAVPVPIPPSAPGAPMVQTPIPIKDFEFSEGGVDFKISNGMVFKKVWADADPEQVRIVSTKNSRVYSGDQYIVQTKSWERIQ